MTELQDISDRETALAPYTGMTFNLAAMLPGRASSRHTQRAYFRWIDTYLVQVGGMEALTGKGAAAKRDARMAALPLDVLQKSLAAPQLRAWLGRLVRDGQGKQGVNQARAAIVTLASLLSEGGWLDDYTSAAMSNVRVPKAQEGQRSGRWLALDQIKLLMDAASDMGTSENQRVRNELVVAMLCTMALRRDELVNLTWAQISSQNNRPVLLVQGKGRKMAHVDMPKPVVRALVRWQKIVLASLYPPSPDSPLVRRIWKGGGVAREGLTVDGIWMIINDSANYAGIGHVAPHDLRRSVAGALQESGVAIDEISRLLRHSNVAVTERYLSKLPQRNEGALLMSDMLGLEADQDGDGGLWG
jgi:site-specific recombinase XerD